MTNVGSATFTIHGDNAQAVRAIREIAREAQRVLGGVTVTPRLDRAALLADLRKATQKVLVEVGVKLKPVTQAQVDAALGKIGGERTVSVDVKGNARAKIDEIKAKLAELKTVAADVVKVDTTTLNTLVTRIREQVAELTRLERELRSLRLGGGAGSNGQGGGTGGGSPGAGSNPYQAQLQGWRMELRAGTASTAEFESALRTLQATIQADLTALRSLGTLTLEDARRMDQMKAALGNVNADLQRLGREATQGGIQQLARDLQVAQSKYERGAIGIRDYLRELERIRTAGQGIAAGLQAGSREAQQLERVMRGLSQGGAKINDQSIVKLRSDLAAARAEFERAIGAAGRFNFTGQRQATQAYEANLRQLEARIRSVGERSTATAAQIRSLNQLSAQLGSQRNAINGTFTQVGLAGNVLNALRSLPQFAMAAGGSLGAMAAQASAVGGGFASIVAQAGPVGLAVGAIGAAALAATAALVSLGRQGLAEVGKLQQGINVLQANGVQDLGAITTQVRQLQVELGTVGGAFTRGQLTQAAADIVKAGVSADDAMKLMASSTRLAAAEQINLNDASGQLLKNLRQYGMGVEDAGRVADMLAKAGNLAAGSANDLSIGFGIVGTTGKQAKIEMYDLLGMLVELDNKGMSAADVGANGLRSAIAALSDVTPKGERSLASLGVKIRDEFGHAKPAGDLLKELGNSLRGMGVEVDRATGQLVGNGDALQIVSSAMDTRAAAAVLGLTGEWKAYGASVKDSLGYHKEYAEIMQQGVIPASERLKNAWKDAGAELMSGFAVPLANVLDTVVTPGIRQMGAFFQQIREGGPVLDEMRGDAVALALAITGIGLAVKRVALQGMITDLVTAFTVLGGWPGLASAIGTAFSGMGTSIAGAFTAAGAAGVAATAILTGVVAAAAALAVTANKIMADTQRAYDAADQGSQQSFDALMARVRALMAENTELSRAKAKYLLLTQQLSDAEQGPLVGVKWTGERIYGPRDEERIKRLQGDLTAARNNITQLTAEDNRRAAAAQSNGGQVTQALKLTDDELKKQAETVKGVRAELSRPAKVFGGTEFQGQLSSITEKYDEMRLKVKESVKDVKLLNDLLRGIKQREGQERGQTRREFEDRARNDALEAERRAQQAAINAMAESSAKRRAQMDFDIAGIRAAAKKQADAWRDFPSEAKRVLAAAEKEISARRRAYQQEENKLAAQAGQKPTAAGMGQQAEYKKSLRDLSTGELEAARATAVATNNRRQMAAILAELTRREREQAQGLKTSGIALTQLKQSLHAVTDARLEELAVQAQQRRDTGAYNAVVAEQSRRAKAEVRDSRERVQVAQQVNKQLSDLALDGVRARLEVGQSEAQALRSQRDAMLAAVEGHARERLRIITAYAAREKAVYLQMAQDQLILAKAQAQGQYAQTVAQIPQGATAAQRGQVVAAAQKILTTQVSSAYRVYGQTVRGAQAQAAKDVADGQRALDSETKKAAEKARADGKKQSDLLTRLRNLNSTFQTALSGGKVDSSRLEAYRQAVDGLRTKINELPAPLRAVFTDLLKTSDGLRASGKSMAAAKQQAADYKASLGTLKTAVTEMTDAELASRLATEKSTDKAGKRVALLEKEIEARRKLREVTLEKGRLELQKGDDQAVVDDYENRVQLAQGNTQKLLAIEQRYGAGVLAARQRLAQVAAREEILQIQERYKGLIDEAKKHGQDTSELEQQQAGAIQQVRDHRDAVQRQNKAQSDQQLIDLTRQAGDDLFQIESEAAARRRGLRQQDADLVISGYEQAKVAAQGKAAELLQIEETLGRDALAARQQQAQLAAETEIAQINSTYRQLIEAARKRGEDTSALEAEQGQAIQAARDKRDATQLANKVAFDQGLINQTRQTNAELVRLANERLDAMDAVENQRGQSTVSAYERAGAQATTGGTEDLTERLRVEQRLGQQVVAARQDMARRAAEAEIRAQTEKYRVLLEKEVEGSDEYKRLQTELGQWIADRQGLLEGERERIAWEGAQARINAEKAVNDAILQLHRDLIDGLNQRGQSEAERRRGQFESDLAQDLRAVGDNEAAKLQILQREQGVREQLARQGINARMASEREAENRRFADLQKSSQWTAADQLLREQLEREHQDRLTEIATQGEYDKGQAVLQIRNQTEDQAQKTQEKRAQDQVKGITRHLNEMTVAQRQSAELTLRGWLATFQAMGVAGQAAAKVIQDALDNVAESNADAQQRAVELSRGLFDLDAQGRYANPETVSRTLADRTNKIGRPETRADAEAKGREAYSSEIESLTKGIADARKVIDELGKVPTGKLTAEQDLALRMARQYLPLFQAQLGKTQQAAQAAGQKAGQAFVEGLKSELGKAQDSGADAGLQLAEANLKLANSQGLTGSVDYDAALQTYRDYWKGRMDVLRQGLATAQAAEDQARTALAGAKTPEAQAAAQDALTKAITATAAAQGDLATATTNYVNGQEKVLAANQLVSEGERALADARSGLAQMLGQSVPLYQSEIQSLTELIKKYPEQAFALGQVRAEYERIQKIRSAGIATKDSLKLDFQTGFNSGAQNLQKSVSDVAQGFGALLSPMGLMATVLDKINIVGTVLEGIMSAIEEPVKALQEPFRIIGEILGSLIAANLRMLAPILEAVVNIFAALYDAIAEFVYTITFGFYDIRRQAPGSSPSERREAEKLKGENDSKQLELDYKAGRISRQQYEDEQLRLLRKRLDREMAEEIENAKSTGADVGEIRRKYALQWEEESATIREQAAQRERELASLIGENQQRELDRQLRAGEITRQQYDERALALLRARLDREEAEAVAAAQGSESQIAAVREKYRLLRLEEEAKLQASLAQQEKELLDLQGDNEQKELDRRHRQRLISDREYAQETYRLTLEKLSRERAAEIAAAEGDQRKILEINRKYDGLILDAKLDMLDQLSQAYRAIGDSLMSSVTGSLKDGLLNALRAGNFGQFRSEFRKNLRQAMFDAVLSAAIETAAIKGLLQPAIDALTAAFQTEGTADDDAAIRGLLAAGSKVEGKMRDIYKALKPLRDAWGIKGEDGQSGSMEVTGKIDTPEVRVSLDALGMLAGVIQQQIPPLTTALPQFSTAVDQFGLHQQAQQSHVAAFGGHVVAFGGYVAQFGQHVQVLAGAARSGGGFTPKR